MDVNDVGDSIDESLELSPTEYFFELFNQLEDCDVDEQIQIILEMIALIEEIDEGEFISVFNEEFYDEMEKMIDYEKIPIEYSLFFLKHVGYYCELKKLKICSFTDSLLSKRFEKMIVDIEKEKEGKDENLLANLCECYVSLSILIQFELAPICVPCLLKVALKKEESEETQTEVELALLALTCFDHFELDKELYLKEVIEIIQYHREHRNLTYLAHHSAWKFLIDRISFQSSSESKIVSEHHFARDAGRELDELSKHIDWKKKEEEEEGERETKDEIVLMEWLRTSSSFFATCGFLTDEFFGLLSSAVGVFRLAYDCNKEINDRCMYLFKEAALNMHVKAEDLIESGAVDVVLEKIIQLDTTNELLTYYLLFFKRLSKRLNEALVGDIHEANRRALQKKIFEKLEEEGYEDCIIGLSLCMIQDTFYEDYFIRKLARLLVLL